MAKQCQHTTGCASRTEQDDLKTTVEGLKCDMDEISANLLRMTEQFLSQGSPDNSSSSVTEQSLPKDNLNNSCLTGPPQEASRIIAEADVHHTEEIEDSENISVASVEELIPDLATLPPHNPAPVAPEKSPVHLN